MNASPSLNAAAPPPNRIALSGQCPAFDHHRFRRELTADALIRRTILAAVIIYFLIGSEIAQTHPSWSGIWMIAVLFAWFWVSLIGARVARQLPGMTALAQQDPAAAEPLIAQALRRHPLPRKLRLLLYERLAMTRLRQGRYTEVVMICQSVLTKTPAQPSGETSGPVSARLRRLASFFVLRPSVLAALRPNLLLMLVEARLWHGDAVGAYFDLLQLHGCELNLTDRLRLLLLQTRYELAIGNPKAVLDHVAQKIRVAELMPTVQCGTMHAMLAAAAYQDRRPDLYDWLGRRAELLCTPAQWQAAVAGRGA